MKCPHCSHPSTRVVDSRPIEENAALKRRRQCDDCGARFTTFERVQSTPLMIVKKDGRREEFSAEKLRSGLQKACSKRPVSGSSIEQSVARIESTLRREGNSEVPAPRVGELVMEELLEIDQIAYVRFASVYQQFDDLKLFAQLLGRMRAKKRET